MKELDLGGWRFYVGDDSRFIEGRTGKWMYFFNGTQDRDFIEERCREVVEQEIVWEAKHSNNIEGVACFYLNIDDLERHKRIINYFFEHKIPRTKTGRLYNISFKMDSQTRAGVYGDEYKAILKLADLMNLDTGEWLV